MKKETKENNKSFKNCFNYSICDEVNKLFEENEKDYTCRECEFIKMKNRALTVK